MRTIRLLAATWALLFFASQTWAQGSIKFDCGYPKGGSTGTIEVQGTYSLDCGWKATGSTATMRVWQDGSLVTIANITYTSSGTFTGSISGLQSCATYNVTVELALISGCTTVTIVTDPGRATAP